MAEPCRLIKETCSLSLWLASGLAGRLACVAACGWGAWNDIDKWADWLEEGRAGRRRPQLRVLLVHVSFWLCLHGCVRCLV